MSKIVAIIALSIMEMLKYNELSADDMLARFRGVLHLVALNCSDGERSSVKSPLDQISILVDTGDKLSSFLSTHPPGSAGRL